MIIVPSSDSLRQSRVDFPGAPAMLPAMGTLYYGDNLDIMRRYLKEESVDLAYLDPPFNSAQNYNAFFHEKDGSAAVSQIRAMRTRLGTLKAVNSVLRSR